MNFHAKVRVETIVIKAVASPFRMVWLGEQATVPRTRENRKLDRSTTYESPTKPTSLSSFSFFAQTRVSNVITFFYNALSPSSSPPAKFASTSR